MARTLKNLKLISGEWTNLYSVFDIQIGTKIIVHNIGANDIYLSAAAFIPATDSDSYQVIKTSNIPMVNESGDPGAWAFSPNQGGKINIQVAP